MLFHSYLNMCYVHMHKFKNELEIKDHFNNDIAIKRCYNYSIFYWAHCWGVLAHNTISIQQQLLKGTLDVKARWWLEGIIDCWVQCSRANRCKQQSHDGHLGGQWDG